MVEPKPTLTDVASKVDSVILKVDKNKLAIEELTQLFQNLRDITERLELASKEIKSKTDQLPKEFITGTYRIRR